MFLPGELHGQRSLVGYNSWGGKESDTTEWLTHCIWSMYIRHIINVESPERRQVDVCSEMKPTVQKSANRHLET